jgi:AIPR protein
MDRITKSLLSEFVDGNGFNNLAEPQQFEHFSCYLLTSRHFTDSFSTEDVCVGDGGDTGIDGISIIVNGCLVTEPEEIEDLCETNGYLDVTFVFVQAETSSSFDSSKIGQFGFGVVDFFNENPALPRNDDVKQKGLVLNEIYNRSSKFKRGNPNCYLYYVTTGKWVNDQNLTVRKQSVESDLNDLGILRNVSFKCIDATNIQTFYRDSKNSISCEIHFPERTVLPEITGVQQAYIGVLKASEYLKLIQNSDEEIIHSLFYDNVRHWQEWNPVNKEIRETLLDFNQQEYFPIFNNGITIVARSINPTGNKFLLEDYQVVNGCQTSYVLYESKENLNDDVRIPVRLIATDNQEIKNAIIKATNRQTQVSDDQLVALTDFPKKLEDFFPSFEAQKRLYYERRSRQYNSVDGIEKVRVINMTTLVRAFASVFLDLPHRTTRNYKALLKSVGTVIFNTDHKLQPYYVAAFAHYRLEYLFRSQIIGRELKAARYHLLMCFRYLASSLQLPRYFNSREMQRYCEDLSEILWDESKYKDLFINSVEILNNVADGNLHRDNIRTEPFTKQLIEKLKAEQS